MTYNPSISHGNILFGIDDLMRKVPTRPDLAVKLCVLLSVAKDLSNSYGQIPMQTIRQLEERYNSLRKTYETAGRVAFRFPIEGPELRLVLDTLHEPIQPHDLFD